MKSLNFILWMLFYCVCVSAENTTNFANLSRNLTLQNASDLSYLLPPNVHLTMKLALTICNGFLLVGVLLGNTLVIHVVSSNLRMRTTTNILITNMAVSDLLIALIFIPSQTIRLYVGSAWFAGTFGMITCKLVMVSRLISVACSTLSLVAIAIDRYYAIAHPFTRRARHTSRNKIWAVSAIWLLSLLICIPPMSFYKQITMTNGDAYCSAVFMFGSTGKAYILGGFVATFIVPVFIMTILYIIVSLKLFKRGLPGYSNEIYKEQVLNTSRRVTIMMVSVVISFTICMLPIQIYLLIRFFNNSVMSLSGLFWGFTLTILISNLNAFLNPCLYMIFNDKFRKGFKNALLCDKEAQLFSISANSRGIAILQGGIKLNNDHSKKAEQNVISKYNKKETPYMEVSRNIVLLAAMNKRETEL